MYNDERWTNRQRQRGWRDDYSEGRDRDEQRWGNQQGSRSDEWRDRDMRSYNMGASQSGYGSSMSSMGGGQGAYYPTEGGYMHDSRYADYGRDYRRYTDNYYRHHGDSSWENQNRDSRRFTEAERNMVHHPHYGQSYQSAYGDGGVGDHMGYGQKGAQYRDEFHGRYGAAGYGRQDRSNMNYGSQGTYDRGGYGGNQGYGTGRNRDMGSRSYFTNTNSGGHRPEENYWNIGNYGERRMNEGGYGYDDRYDRDDGRNRNTRNYTW
jgi:hypothetical protein